MQEGKYSKKEMASSKKYLRELVLVLALYLVTLIVSIKFAQGMVDGMLRTVVVVLPVLPAFGLLWAVLRFFRRMDEYQRIRVLEILAMAGAITVCVSFSYGFLEGIGYPRLSGFVIYAVYMGSWLILTFVRKWWER